MNDVTGSSGPRRILFALRDAAEIKACVALLSTDDYEIRTASDSRTLLESVGQFDPHVILLDPGFGDGDGLEVCKTIKTNPSSGRIKVLVVIALRELREIEMLVEAGADDFLSKPINKAELRKRVELLGKLRDCEG